MSLSILVFVAAVLLSSLHFISFHCISIPGSSSYASGEWNGVRVRVRRNAPDDDEEEEKNKNAAEIEVRC